MGLQVIIRSIRYAFQFIPLFLSVITIRTETILQVNTPLGIMRKLLPFLPILPEILRSHAQGDVPVVSIFNPAIVPFVVATLSGFENLLRHYKVLNVDLF